MIPVLIVGCGYTGRRLARALQARGEAVQATVRRPESAAALTAEGIPASVVDLDTPPLPAMPLSNARVFYLAPPPAEGTADRRMAAFLAACGSLGQPSRILYFSTTGVYGDCGGAWIDETHPASPTAARAQRRLDAEGQLLAWRHATGGQLVILRVAGIYGPGRLPLERLQRGLPLVAEQEAPFTNRIHVDDLVSVALAAMDLAPDGALYNACDGHPTTMNDYFNQVADLTGLPRPPTVSLAEAPAALSAGMLSYARESRRLSNRRLRDELGVVLRYPTLAEGLAQCMEPEN